MISKCPVCEKKFDVLWPHLWSYKRDGKYLCTWRCLRAFDDKKEAQKFMKMSKEQREKAIEMAIAGGNPLKYLEECGAKSPSGTWYHIKKDLKAKDPDRYMELPEKYRPADEPKPIDGGEWEKMETPEKAVKAEIPEKANRPVSAPVPVWRTDFEISAVRNSLGEFYYDKKFNCIDWRTIEGDEVSMAPRAWLELIGILPDVMKVLGVEAE